MLYCIEAIDSNNAICVIIRRTKEEAKASLLELEQQGITVSIKGAGNVPAKAYGLDWYASDWCAL